jgi:hypothetical protein
MWELTRNRGPPPSSQRWPFTYYAYGDRRVGHSRGRIRCRSDAVCRLWSGSYLRHHIDGQRAGHIRLRGTLKKGRTRGKTDTRCRMRAARVTMGLISLPLPYRPSAQKTSSALARIPRPRCSAHVWVAVVHLVQCWIDRRTWRRRSHRSRARGPLPTTLASIVLLTKDAAHA